jgi:PAS domain S-box-containing protein
MSLARWGQCALLLALIGLCLSAPHLDGTRYGGWPALGFAIALFLVAGPKRFWLVVAAEAVVVGLALTFAYDLPPWATLPASLIVIVPAWFAQRMLVKTDTGRLRLDEVDSDRYHLVTAVTALLCGVAALVGTVGYNDLDDVLLISAMAFLTALTAQLAVLPLFIRGSTRPAAGAAAELVAQRVSVVVAVALVFSPTARLGIVFVIFPLLGWAANRASRREAHWQLFLVCAAAYALTISGRGPFSGPVGGVPESLNPVLLHLFLAAACYMTVPLTMTVERLVAMTGQATRAATTVERLLDSVSGAMIIATDARGLITHFNSGAQQTLGYSPEEVIGRSPMMFHTTAEIESQAAHFGVPPDHEVISLEMVRHGERRDWEFIRKDGTPRTASLTLSQVTDVDGQVIGFIGAGDDITDRLRAEEALVTALDREHASVLRLEEVDHVKQELVSNVSHELRTPITSISGYAELLTEGDLGELTGEQADAVRRIQRNTERLRLLVEDLLTLSKAETGLLEMAHEQVDLRQVVAESIDLLQELLRVRTLNVDVVLPDTPSLVIGDNHALERVVLNLLGNAIKFTPDSGHVTLTVSETSHLVTLTVADTGIGISEEDQEHLFTRFFRTSAATARAIQGSGLGLSIVHSIVSQHGGSVSVESAPDAGTTVTVELPRLPDQRVTVAPGRAVGSSHEHGPSS